MSRRDLIGMKCRARIKAARRCTSGCWHAKQVEQRGRGNCIRIAHVGRHLTANEIFANVTH